MNTPMTVLVLLLLLFVWLFVRRRQPGRIDAPRKSVRTSKATTAYHAVSIKFTSNACNAAHEMEGRRFLSSAAPRLPLPECDVLECNCRFVHHQDRRVVKDRRSPFGPSGLGGGTGNFVQEQRQGKERRSSEDDDLY